MSLAARHARPRSVSMAVTSTELTTVVPAASASPRSVRSTDCFRALGQPCMQRPRPSQPTTLRRMGRCSRPRASAPRAMSSFFFPATAGSVGRTWRRASSSSVAPSRSAHGIASATAASAATHSS